MIELKPCPFCGSKAELWAKHWDSDNTNGSTGFDIRCRTGGRYLEDGTASYYDTFVEVAEKWNKRSD